MVQKLNLILITSPELAEFRKRLKTLETRVRFAFLSSSPLLGLNFATAGWTGVVYYLVQIMVSQRCRSILLVSAGASI
jgi:hypothetical protein